MKIPNRMTAREAREYLALENRKVRRTIKSVGELAITEMAGSGTSERRKYGNQKVSQSGINFDSKVERARYQHLVTLERCKMISGLKVHPRYKIASAVRNPSTGRMMPVRYYVADFEYLDERTGERIVEDVKSPQTRRNAAYTLKRHLFILLYGKKLRHREVMKGEDGTWLEK